MTAKNPIVIPPITTEEEDQVILARISNDERPLKRVLKKFHSYASVAPAAPLALASNTDIEDARESFLVELATFQLSLQKSNMICEAEARQVEEYQKERQRLDDEYGTLRGQIEQLKTSLEHAQMIRRRKIEYDVIAEKINTLPTREELEKTIQDLENDLSTIKVEHEDQSRMIQSQKLALDSIVTDLQSLRFVGKDREVAASVLPSPSATPAPEGDGLEGVELEDVDIGEVKHEEGEESEEKEEGEEKEETKGEVDNVLNEDDIEMGEVEEDVKDFKKKKAREELEEGEASDGSSELSEPPDDV